MLNEPAIDNAARRWVDKVTPAVFDKEALCDTLVHHNESDLGRCSQAILHVLKRLSELLDLLVDDLSSHSVANTVAEDDEVSGQLAVMLLREDVDGLFQRICHLSLHDLLAFGLHDVL